MVPALWQTNPLFAVDGAAMPGSFDRGGSAKSFSGGAEEDTGAIAGGKVAVFGPEVCSSAFMRPDAENAPNRLEGGTTNQGCVELRLWDFFKFFPIENPARAG